MRLYFKALYCTLTIASTLLLASCASTSTNGTSSGWKDPDFSTPLSKVLVIGIHSNLKERRLYENTLVKLLKTNGVQSVSSISTFPADKELNRDMISSAIKSDGFDSVLVTRVTKEEPNSRSALSRRNFPIHAYRRNLYDFYYRSYPIVHSKDYYQSNATLTLETNLYSTMNSGLVWSNQSESFNPTNIKDVSDDVSKSIVSNLTKDQLINKPAAL